MSSDHWGARPATAPAHVPARPLDPLRLLRAAPHRVTRAAFRAACVSLLLYAAVRHVVAVSMVDMVVYRAEGAAVLHGSDLYSFHVTHWGLPATYPPFAAIAFGPAALVDVPVLRVLVTGGNLVLLGVVAWQSCELADWPRRPMRPAAVMVATGFGVWLEPVFTTLSYGQINLALAALVLSDLNRRRGGRRWRGAAIGVAAGLKITPGFFVLYLLVTGQWRAARNAALTCVGTVGIGGLLLPRASWDYWTSYLWQTSRVGHEYIVDNQSLRGMLDRALHTVDADPWALGASVIVAAGGLVLARTLHRADGLPRSRAWAAMCCAVTMVLVSPISWTHHWIWCVPLIVLLAAEAAHERRAGLTRRWRATAVAAVVGFCSFSMWLVPHKGLTNLKIPTALQPASSLYPLMGLAFLALAALQARCDRRQTASRAPVPRQRQEQQAAALN
ncbi:glycosyltransferase 87 family protein [Streptacidiphilus rugosus]|uniref:glycosyltransferase 87 family protein n=1 Tax=Streptacidiphilus rugosus TaxID=405783 RepID=UPI0018DC03A2|nr:glycosyltransferase 87 family protein [Streptacidiphilus rugosus]